MALKMYDLAGAAPERRFSPFCWRSKLAIAHKGLAVETIAWRFTDKALLPQPNKGFVPVLVDNGKVVTDSWAIANHLEADYPDKPSLFGGDEARAVTHALNAWCDGSVHPTLARPVVADIYDHVAPQDKDYFKTSREARFAGRPLANVQATRDTDVAAFRTAINPVRVALAERAFLGGARPMYAGYIVMGCFLWVRGISRFELLASEDAVMRGWRQRMVTASSKVVRASPGYDA